ncbi:MAG TPA: hypothetical protein VNS32_17950 [Flavisolibacter sp.]|nr:hypothetical protein [Flavisolibacter sp.]
MSIKQIMQRTSIFWLWLLLAGCVNLKKVNDYASTSSKNIKKFEELGYSFVKACDDKCIIGQLDNKQFKKSDCECKVASNEADSVTLVLYNAVKDYFDGLEKLSGNDVTSYKFDALAKALKEGNFGDVKINKDHVDAYAKISSILTNAITNGYRKKSLSKYIGEANDAVKVLLNALQFNLVSNLSKTLETKRERYKDFYFDLYTDATTSAYEKVKIIQEFNSVNSELDNKKKEIIAFGKGLNTIAQGHQKLFENKNKLNNKELKELLSQYASDIQDIVDEFNKLKNQD